MTELTSVEASLTEPESESIETNLKEPENNDKCPSETGSYVEVHMSEIEEADMDNKQNIPIDAEPGKVGSIDTSPPPNNSVAEQEITQNEQVEDSEKENLILHQFPVGKHTPGLSVLALRLETFIRLNNLPYENQYSYNYKAPWVSFNGKTTQNSTFIFEHLSKDFNLEDSISEEDKAYGCLITRLMENSLYHCVSFNAWVDDFNGFKRTFVPENSPVKLNVGLNVMRRNIKGKLSKLGYNIESKEVVYDRAQKDLETLSTFLGEKEFLFGSSICSFDCTTFAFIANILWAGIESPMSTWINQNAENLVKYSERIRDIYWSDWDEVCSKFNSKDGKSEQKGGKIKKRFSFKKSKKSPGSKKSDDKKDNQEKNVKNGEIAQENGNIVQNDGLVEVDLNE